MFITFEGPEGGGKTTALTRLEAWLLERHKRVVTTREPGGTPLGERIRPLVVDDEEAVPYASLLLIEAARAQVVATVIRPALERHAVVLCDRFTDSTLAYQGFGDGTSLDDIRVMNRIATGGLTPDLTMLLDVEPIVGLRRRGRAGGINAIDRRDVEYHRRVRDGFLSLASLEPARWIVLDASRPPAEVDAEIADRVSALLISR